MWCGDRSGGTAKLDHEPAPIGERGVAQHHEEIDVGVGSIRSISYRAEQDDLLRIERADDDIDEVGHPLAQGTPGPYGTVVTHCVGDLIHERRVPDPCASGRTRVRDGDGRPIYELDGLDGLDGRLCGRWSTAARWMTNSKGVFGGWVRVWGDEGVHDRCCLTRYDLQGGARPVRRPRGVGRSSGLLVFLNSRCGLTVRSECLGEGRRRLDVGRRRRDDDPDRSTGRDLLESGVCFPFGGSREGQDG